MMNERNNRLINKIQNASFCLLDTALFLDTHPNDTMALAHYKKIRDIYSDLVEEYENQCGPLTISGNNFDKWAWVKSPWPWEGDAN